MFGSRIASHLLNQADARVRLLIRPTEDKTRKTALSPLFKRGAEIVEGDLADESALDRATQGVDVIVSAVQGGSDVIIDGQVALAKAGKRNGARRILPSDYALDPLSGDARRTHDVRHAGHGGRSHRGNRPGTDQYSPRRVYGCVLTGPGRDRPRRWNGQLLWRWRAAGCSDQR